MDICPDVIIRISRYIEDQYILISYIKTNLKIFLMKENMFIWKKLIFSPEIIRNEWFLRQFAKGILIDDKYIENEITRKYHRMITEVIRQIVCKDKKLIYKNNSIATPWIIDISDKRLDLRLNKYKEIIGNITNIEHLYTTQIDFKSLNLSNLKTFYFCLNKTYQNSVQDKPIEYLGINLSKNIKKFTFKCTQYDFILPVSLKKLKYLDISHNNSINIDNICDSITYLDISNTNCYDMKNINKLHKLRRLYAADNHITTIDISQSLIILDISNNPIFDIIKCKAKKINIGKSDILERIIGMNIKEIAVEFTQMLKIKRQDNILSGVVEFSNEEVYQLFVLYPNIKFSEN